MRLFCVSGSDYYDVLIATFSMGHLYRRIINYTISFVISTANLPEDAFPRRILEARADATTGVVRRYSNTLMEMGLPDIKEILQWLVFTVTLLL